MTHLCIPQNTRVTIANTCKRYKVIMQQAQYSTNGKYSVTTNIIDENLLTKLEHIASTIKPAKYAGTLRAIVKCRAYLSGTGIQPKVTTLTECARDIGKNSNFFHSIRHNDPVRFRYFQLHGSTIVEGYHMYQSLTAKLLNQLQQATFMYESDTAFAHVIAPKYTQSSINSTRQFIRNLFASDKSNPTVTLRKYKTALRKHYAHINSINSTFTTDS